MTNESGIYAIENAVTGAFYIGSSVSIAKRKREHLCGLRNGTHANERLQRAFAKYGAEAFVWHAVALVAVDDLLATEQRLLDRLVSLPACYNMAVDAGSGMRGRKHTAESLAKLDASLRVLYADPMRRLKCGDAMRGKKHSPETRAKMSAVHTARYAAHPEHRALLSRPQSPEAVAKRAASNRGKKRTGEKLERMRAVAIAMGTGNRGRKQSPEQRARKAEQMRELWRIRKSEVRVA